MIGATSRTLAVEHRTVEQVTVEVRVLGELTVRTSSELHRELRGYLAARPGGIHVDLSAVTDIDAAGLMAVSAPLLAARRAGVEIDVTEPAAAEPRAMAELTGILPLLAATR